MDFLNGDENEVLNEGHFGYQKVKGNIYQVRQKSSNKINLSSFSVKFYVRQMVDGKVERSLGWKGLFSAIN